MNVWKPNKYEGVGSEQAVQDSYIYLDLPTMQNFSLLAGVIDEKA